MPTRFTDQSVIQYSSHAGDVNIPMGIDFTQDSEPDGQTNQFTLTCISIGGPATTVTWTRDSEFLSHGSTVLNNSVTGQYIHTLTVIGRLEGVYTCNVSNNKPSSAVKSLTVEGRGQADYSV